MNVRTLHDRTMKARRVRSVLTAVAISGVLAVTGCGADPAAAPAPGPATGAAGATGAGTTGAGQTGAAVAGAVPASLTFGGKTLDGAAFDAASMAGKPTVLWFWAPWCATCAGQASSVTDLQEQYGDKLAILGIAGMGDNKAMHEFVSDLDVGSVTNLDDEAGKLWKRFKIVEQSTYVLIDRQGKIKHTGFLDDVDLNAQVKSLVA